MQSSFSTTYFCTWTQMQIMQMKSLDYCLLSVIGPLRLNERDDRKDDATIKILQCHDDFDILPFFEWESSVCLRLSTGSREHLHLNVKCQEALSPILKGGTNSQLFSNLVARNASIVRGDLLLLLVAFDKL